MHLQIGYNFLNLMKKDENIENEAEEWHKMQNFEFGRSDSIGTFSYHSKRKYNSNKDYSSYHETKQIQLRTDFMKAFIKLLDIFSNNDRISFFHDLLKHNFQNYFPSSTIYMIDGFKTLAQALADSYSIQPTPEGKTQILSIITNYIPEKYIPQIFGTDISRRQIYNAKLSAATSGPGILNSKPSRTVSSATSQFQTKILNFFKIVYRYSLTLYPNQTRNVNTHNSAYFNQKTFSEEKTQITQRLQIPKNEIYYRMLQEFGRKNCFSRTVCYKLLKSDHFVYYKKLSALCENCSKYGFLNFEKIKFELDQVGNTHTELSSQITHLKSKLDQVQKFLRVDLFSGEHFSSNAHSTTATHCPYYLLCCSQTEFGGLSFSEAPCCKEEHKMDCEACNEEFILLQKLKEISSVDPNFADKISKFEDKLKRYHSHLIRHHVQRGNYKRFESLLSGTNAIILTDFKMKILYENVRESQTSWFAKRGNSNLGIVFIYKNLPSEEIKIEYFDLFSEDNTQDFFFICSAFEVALKQFKIRHPEIQDSYLLSDNGASFHSSGFIMWLMNVFGISWNESIRVFIF